MKRKLLGLMTMFIAIGTLSGLATNDNKDKNCDTQQCKKECCDKAKCDSKCLNPFEGITLTADQQAKLDVLKSNKEARPDRRQMKREYLAKVKEILTPDQYVVFLENSFVNTPMRPHKDMRHSGHHGHR